jgi:hypothetical protein
MAGATGSTTGRHGALNVAITTIVIERMAGTTRLELATSAVTGQRSNQLNYVPAARWQALRECAADAVSWRPRLPGAESDEDWWAVQDSNLRPSRCKRDALTN